ncbi:alpha/beta fold hydrolase [Niveispirillum sp. SYP-B3756]|nr:alpha/beta fold hydrolase [Niveispirillum sp. SYP-B3756]
MRHKHRQQKSDGTGVQGVAEPQICKAYVAVAGGQVHYRRAGSGPPLVLLHDSPRSSLLHLDLIRHLADRFTVYALDTPGYGESSPLTRQGRALEVADFAEALAATVAALGLEKAGFYGFHTSSKILLDFAVRHPEKVAVALLDGLSIAKGGKPDPAFIDAYMRPFTVDADGSFLVREWTRVRDTWRWFPWFAASPPSRMPIAQPPLAEIHDYFLDYAMAGPNYASAYRAAMEHQPLDNVGRITAPTQIFARADDVLFGCLDLLPSPGPAGLSVARLSADRSQWMAHIKDMFERYRADMQAVPAPVVAIGGPFSHYIDLPHGQMRVQSNAGIGRPILLLHDLPGGAMAAAGLQAALAAGGRPVHAPDLPGCGQSDPLPLATADAYATALAQAVKVLELGPFDLVANGLSVPLALALLRAGLPIQRAVLDGMPLLGTEARAGMLDYLAAPLAPDRAGTHVLRGWHALRDAAASFPAQDGGIAAVRSDSAALEGQSLFLRLLDMLKQPTHQGDALRAAFDHDAAVRLADVPMPILLPVVAGDPLYGQVPAVARMLARANIQPRPADVSGRAALFLSFLAG